MEVNFRFAVILAVALLLFIIFQLSLKKLKKHLLSKAKNKRQISNIKVLTRIISVSLFLLIILSASLAYIRSWTSLGIFAGLITAGLSFALQRPIAGVAAWLMIIIQRPFRVGDRIIIGNVRGDVYDITLTHIYLDEVGENTAKGDVTGRNIMVPNYLFFEQNVINYTLVHEFVLTSLDVGVTFESDLDKAREIIEKVAKKHLGKLSERHKEEPYTRISMSDSSMIIGLRFYAPAKKMNEIKSEITKEIYDLIKAEKDIHFAYPHTEIVFKDRKMFK